ncbi:MAG: hypothetical protein JOZ18_21055 [Chloroflexi bacterium]|nr:hypothetical protein [Chloroflexota bacterium]
MRQHDQQPYDSSVKAIFQEDTASILPHILEGAEFIDVLDIEVMRPPMRADRAYRIKYDDNLRILILEFQAGEDDDIAYRLLIYRAILWRDYKLPVISMIVYLFRAKMPESPLTDSSENDLPLTFHFLVIGLLTLDARQFVQKHAISIYPLLPAMDNADAQLLLQVIDEMVECYQDNEAKLERHLLWFSIFLRRTDTVSPPDKLKVRERLNTFERLLEEDEWVQRQRKLGEEKGREKGREEGRVLSSQQTLVDVVSWRYPSLVALAQQRAAQLTQIDTLSEVIRLLVLAPDEETARFILNTLPTG